MSNTPLRMPKAVLVQRQLAVAAMLLFTKRMLDNNNSTLCKSELAEKTVKSSFGRAPQTAANSASATKSIQSIKSAPVLIVENSTASAVNPEKMIANAAKTEKIGAKTEKSADKKSPRRRLRMRRTRSITRRRRIREQLARFKLKLEISIRKRLTTITSTRRYLHYRELRRSRVRIMLFLRKQHAAELKSWQESIRRAA